MNALSNTTRPAREKTAAIPAAVPLRLDAASLFAGRHEIAITHGTETYVLRLTRQNKLILTK